MRAARGATRAQEHLMYRKSNDLQNWIKPKRKLRNRANSLPAGERESERNRPTGTFLQQRARTECQRRAPSGILRAPSWLSPPRPPRPAGRSDGYPPSDETIGPGFGLHSEHVRWPNASRILSEITHSRSEALFRNNSCCPRGSAYLDHGGRLLLFHWPSFQFPSRCDFARNRVPPYTHACPIRRVWGSYFRFLLCIVYSVLSLAFPRGRVNLRTSCSDYSL